MGCILLALYCCAPSLPTNEAAIAAFNEYCPGAVLLITEAGRILAAAINIALAVSERGRSCSIQLPLLSCMHMLSPQLLGKLTLAGLNIDV